jgi:hypothetical protein
MMVSGVYWTTVPVELITSYRYNNFNIALAGAGMKMTLDVSALL